MPIFARTKLVIHDDCLSPAPGSPYPGLPFVTLNYRGPNPQKIYHKIKELFVTIWKIDPHELQERDFKWDISKGEEKFSVTFDMVKDLDRFSFIQVVVSLKGNARPSKEFGKEGSATIKVEGKLRTEYPQDTFWQRNILYEMVRIFLHRVFYEEKRKKYKEECRANLIRFLEELKSFLNMLPKSV